MTLTGDEDICGGDFKATNPSFDHVFTVLMKSLQEATEARSQHASIQDADDSFGGIDELISKSEMDSGDASFLTPALKKCHDQFKACWIEPNYYLLILLLTNAYKAYHWHYHQRFQFLTIYFF